MTYNDEQAKAILSDSRYWPRLASTWNGANQAGQWARCTPKGESTATMPKLMQAGSRLFKIDPDGMWARFNAADFVDVVVFEVSRSEQNLNDKRSRYMPQGSSLLLEVRYTWLNEEIHVRGGGLQRRRDTIGALNQLPEATAGIVQIPTRFLRAVFVVPDTLYRKLKNNYVPIAHEFFMRHESLKSGTSQKMQEFMSRISLEAHFYTR